MRPMRTTAGVTLALIAVVALAGAARCEVYQRFSVELEAGSVWQTRNDVQIPNSEEGTRFSLVDLAGREPWFAARLYFTYNINRKHSMRLLLAPLSITESGVPSSALAFAGETFEAGLPAEATYKFNSWRLTYRYRFYEDSRWRWWVGFTAKIRDARIAVSQGDRASEKTDTGFVPLLHVAGEYRFRGRWAVSLDMDALAGGPGRAEDLALRAHYDLSDRWRIAGGYRTVEGGADVEEVYNFAWFHYGVVSALYRF
jgi:hypothetical protein